MAFNVTDFINSLSTSPAAQEVQKLKDLNTRIHDAGPGGVIKNGIKELSDTIAGNSDLAKTRGDFYQKNPINSASGILSLANPFAGVDVNQMIKGTAQSINDTIGQPVNPQTMNLQWPSAAEAFTHAYEKPVETASNIVAGGELAGNVLGKGALPEIAPETPPEGTVPTPAQHAVNTFQETIGDTNPSDMQSRTLRGQFNLSPTEGKRIGITRNTWSTLVDDGFLGKTPAEMRGLSQAAVDSVSETVNGAAAKIAEVDPAGVLKDAVKTLQELPDINGPAEEKVMNMIKKSVVGDGVSGNISGEDALTQQRKFRSLAETTNNASLKSLYKSVAQGYQDALFDAVTKSPAAQEVLGALKEPQYQTLLRQHGLSGLADTLANSDTLQQARTAIYPHVQALKALDLLDLKGPLGAGLARAASPAGFAAAGGAIAGAPGAIAGQMLGNAVQPMMEATTGPLQAKISGGVARAADAIGGGVQAVQNAVNPSTVASAALTGAPAILAGGSAAQSQGTDQPAAPTGLGGNDQQLQGYGNTDQQPGGNPEKPGVNSAAGRYALSSPQDQGLALTTQDYTDKVNQVQAIINQEKLNNPQQAAIDQGKLDQFNTKFNTQQTIVNAYTGTNAVLGQANQAYSIAQDKGSDPTLLSLNGSFDKLRASTDPKYAKLLANLQYLQTKTGVDLASSKTKEALLANIDQAASIAMTDYNAVLQQFIGGNTLNAGQTTTNVPTIQPPQAAPGKAIGQPVNYDFNFGKAGENMPSALPPIQ
jgi:hypothetical protein